MTQPTLVSEAENINNNNSKDSIAPKTPSMLSEPEKKEFDVNKKLESIEDFKEAALHVAKEMEKVTTEHKLLQKKIRDLRGVAQRIDGEMDTKKTKGLALSAVEMPNLKPVAEKLTKWYRREQRRERKKEKTWSELCCALLVTFAVIAVVFLCTTVYEQRRADSCIKGNSYSFCHIEIRELKYARDAALDHIKYLNDVSNELSVAKKEIETLKNRPTFKISNELIAARKEIETLKNGPTFNFSRDFDIGKFIRSEYQDVKYTTTVHKITADILFNVSLFSVLFFLIGVIFGGGRKLNPEFKKMKLRLKKIETGIDSNIIETNNIQVALNGQSDHFKNVCKELRETGALLNPVAPPAQKQTQDDDIIIKENFDTVKGMTHKEFQAFKEKLYGQNSTPEKKDKKEMKMGWNPAF